MSRRTIPSWQKAKRHGHAKQRHPKRPAVHAPLRPSVSLMLWTVNGEPVTSFLVAPSACPSHIDFGGLRYDLVGGPDRGNRVAHYQTRTVVPRAQHVA